MNIEKFKERMSQIGNIEVIKEGAVFTLLIKGKGLSNLNIVNKISADVIDTVGTKYPIVEVISNDDDFFLIILSPQIKI